MVQSSHSAGKSTLADAVASLVPPEDQVSYSALTGQALYYLGAGGLTHKVLCVAEEEGASKAVYAIKLLVSSGHLAIVSTGKDADTGKLVTKTYEVQGPVALLMTTTAPMVDEELASRLVAITVSESVSQTRAIHCAQRTAYSAAGLAAKASREAITSRHHNAQRLIEPMPVVIAMADELAFSDATTRSRRDHDKYLSLIAASALLHQHQREVKTVNADSGVISYVEATSDDVALADRLAMGVIIRDCSDLPPVTAALLSSLASWAGTEPFTRRAAREALGLGDTQLKVHLARLVELEYALCLHSGRSVSYQLAWGDPGLTRNSNTGNDPGDRSSTDSMRGETIRSGQKTIRSGSGRGEVGGRSGSNRPTSNGSSSQVRPRKSAPSTTASPTCTYRDEAGDYPYEVALRSAGDMGGRRS